MAAHGSYLRSDVAAEPLWNRWVAWPYLVPPASAALYLKRAHLPTLRSYLENPEAHVERARTKSISLGDPTVAYLEPKVNEARALLERTLAENKDLLALADALDELEALLRRADGKSVEALYAEVPELLRGYVELVYDIRHRPSYRLLEGLLYRSPFFKRSSQGFALQPISGDDRLTVLGTPRFEGVGEVSLRVPFDHPAVDALFAARSEPCDPRALAERLGVTASELPAFLALFTAEAPPPPSRYQGEGARARYYGHACALLESRGSTVLVDPLLSYRNSGGAPRFDVMDLPPRIDVAVITHGHEDHLHLETLLQLRGRIGTVVVPRGAGGGLLDPSLKQLLHAVGFKSVVELAELESLPLADGSITALPFFGEHGDLDIRGKGAFLVELAGTRTVFVADSNNVEPRAYERVFEAVGPGADMLFVGMECDGSPLHSLYGPMFPAAIPDEIAQSRRYTGSDFPKALNLVDQLKPSHVYVYAMGQEPWLFHIMNITYTEASRPIVESNRLVAECRRRGISAERLFCKKEVLLPPRGQPGLSLKAG